MNILIIDDEPLIHLSIEKLVLDCSKDSKVFHAYNGLQMLDILKETHIQLAYVDIKMPGLTGLDAIRLARDISPSTHYYIMTGFNEFEYAKQAVKLKVEDYLMKPLDLKTISETVRAAEQSELREQMEKKAFLRSWLENTIGCRNVSLGKYNSYYGFIALFAFDKAGFPPKYLLDTLEPYSDNFVSSFIDNRIILFCFSDRPDILHDMSNTLVSRQYTEGVTVFISTITENSVELKENVQNIIHYSCLRVVRGIERLYHLKPLMDCSSELMEFSELCIKWRSSCLSENYTDFCSNSKLICSQLELSDELGRFAKNILKFLSYTLDSDEIIDCDPAQLRICLNEYAKKLIPTSESNKLAGTIIEFINEHYRENISVSQLADQFGFSANYISNILKQELGMPYSKYITELRLKYAKDLLLFSGTSVKDITVACGYFSQSHFTKIFLEHEGCTPAEYRKRNMSEQ